MGSDSEKTDAARQDPMEKRKDDQQCEHPAERDQESWESIRRRMTVFAEGFAKS